MRVLPEPSHELVGFSYEVFPDTRRRLAHGMLVIATIAAGVAAAVRLV